MKIPPHDQLILAGEVLVKWGFWMIVYGAITMCIGLAIIVILNKQNIKYLR
ncbi:MULTISPECIES: hypothetical protein [Clostridium]|uniref:hypothetical protein n=1 Tax=Clostridium TaxID=1485 RepID=UPI0015E16CE7|nr:MULTISPECIES: hypothetical protein [Clostridium]MBN7576036.1 hypothetical protein [Clostridium beijerinckii]MBN7581131.1 hypothetical protein [Clostridium beijerinckii]MBN7585757.1 hypothetical protein [Clostridium beijerinckii]MBO0521546.1 hypothetical protein [Clostridium beijerinckii]